MVGIKNDDSAAKKEPLGGTVTHTLGAGFGRVFAPGASRTREKALFLRAFPVDPGGSPGGRTLARAAKHSMCFAQSAALRKQPSATC